MPREAHWPTRGRVVHVVGLVTDEVFSFLGPTTEVLASAGRKQTVVMIDEPRYRYQVDRLQSSVAVVLAPRIRNPLRQFGAMLRACRKTLEDDGVQAVHLHGLIPFFVGLLALRPSRRLSSIYFSPHASRSLRFLGMLKGAIRLAVRPVLRRTRHAVIVNLPLESREFSKWDNPELVESPISDTFFDIDRHPARHPLIVTGGREQSVGSAELFSQLAVLLGGQGLQISFNWIGTVDDATHKQLAAAGIGVFDVVGDADSAARLAAGWVYLAPGSTRGFPLFLVEAMAVGLPCVAFDCPQHRDLIVDGQTGFLCHDDRDMVVRIASLVDDPALRARIGRAAREAVRGRFTEAVFGRKLLAAYEIRS